MQQAMAAVLPANNRAIIEPIEQDRGPLARVAMRLPIDGVLDPLIFQIDAVLGGAKLRVTM